MSPHLPDTQGYPWPINPTPPPPVSVFVPVMFAAWDPLAAVGWNGRLALSGDPAYREANVNALEFLRKHFATIVGWADDPTLALELVRELGLDGWIGQAETEEQALLCLDSGAEEIIGNASSLTPNTRRLIVESGATFLQEAYWGDSQGAPSHVSAAGIPARLVPGIYPACKTAEEYLADMPGLALPGGPLGGVYLAEGGNWAPFNAACETRKAA